MGEGKVAVLLAAYNGSDWIQDQLLSIINQEYVEITVYISVDKSTDNTLEICESFASQYRNVFIISKNVKYGSASQNFFHLIKRVAFQDYDYIALADQDDLWYKDKLVSGIRRMRKGGYLGYSSNVIAFWSDGKRRLIRKHFPQRRVDYLFESPGPGCTFILRSSAVLNFKDYIERNSDLIQSIDLHDWAIYAFFRSRGYSWLIDKNVSMLYRQHGSNAFGANVNLGALFKRMRLLIFGWYFTQVSLISCLSNHEVPTVSFILKNLGETRRNFWHRVVLAVSYMLFWRSKYIHR